MGGDFYFKFIRIDCKMNKKPIREIAEELGVSKQAVFLQN